MGARNCNDDDDEGPLLLLLLGGIKPAKRPPIESLRSVRYLQGAANRSQMAEQRT